MLFLYLAANMSTTVFAATFGDYGYTVSADGATITVYTGTAVNLTAPDTINTAVLIVIKSNAFSNNTTLITLVMPSSLRIIDGQAFRGCSGLQGVELK